MEVSGGLPYVSISEEAFGACRGTLLNGWKDLSYSRRNKINLMRENIGKILNE